VRTWRARWHTEHTLVDRTRSGRPRVFPPGGAGAGHGGGV
jgi:hypothetical protein